MGRLSGKVALITGAARGQGAAEAELFAKEGAKVIMTDLQVEELNKLADQIKENGGSVLALKQDVSSEEDWENVVAEGIKAFGKIDILVNNAGILSFKTITEISKAEFEKIMSINTTGTFLGMKYVIPNMQENGGGSIVNISSLSGIYGVGGAATIPVKELSEHLLKMRR
ncbi:short-chain dehydrogenase/reductase SDR [Listeria floridensis FSL S10-1187]|uniref:Short-chain dehydrogenase/reductase SDR n=1 Tax=Listeria floridensis FSL S10-1187 TaxID=1265817 RepID=A0ABP3AZ13_9LIST|nr:short-chain dehydrogenase/reductase SDR [Listeria floridensis FSL S10-1187]